MTAESVDHSSITEKPCHLPSSATPVAFRINTQEPMSNASFSFDDTVVMVVGKTLDQCGDAIDVTVMEKNKACILFSTRNTKTYTEAEVKQTDDESIVVDFY
jgi:hypothetical protein